MILVEIPDEKKCIKGFGRRVYNYTVFLREHSGVGNRGVSFEEGVICFALGASRLAL